jgi:hypothetical protein
MGDQIKDITGRRFGRLTALRLMPERKHGQACWLCECECGSQRVVHGFRLRGGYTKSCGCIHIKDITGQRFGRLTALRLAPERKNRMVMRAIVRGRDLCSGNTRSCGCLPRGKPIKPIEESRALYLVWKAMIQRCEQPSCKSYKNYGARGITVCARWRNSLENFLADMGRRPSPQHSIDRIDNDQGYFPENCRWSTRSEQRRNQRHPYCTTQPEAAHA